MNLSNDITNRKMSIMRASKLENIPYEEQAKFVNDRLVNTENRLAKICTAFSLYIKRISSLRNATDNLALALHEYAAEEKINKSSKDHILKFAELLASIGDYRDIEMNQLDSELLKELCHYEVLCLNAKAKVKSILNLKEKEINKRKQLQKLRNRNPYNRERIIKAEASLSIAVSGISRSLKELEEHINQFEKRKLQDIKSLLMKFIKIEMVQHCSAIQLLTESFNEISKINEADDLRDFEKIMKKNISKSILGNETTNIIKELNTVNNSQSNNINSPDQKIEFQHHCDDSIQSDSFSTSDSYSVTGKDYSLTSEKKHANSK